MGPFKNLLFAHACNFGLRSFPIHIAVLSDFSSCSSYHSQLDLTGKQFIKKSTSKQDETHLSEVLMENWTK